MERWREEGGGEGGGWEEEGGREGGDELEGGVGSKASSNDCLRFLFADGSKKGR